MKNPSFGASQSFAKSNQECKEEKQREESNMNKFKRRAAAGHISSTFWSLFYTYYISFRSLGSQQSNALNSVQIGAELKTLWPLEDNHTKLKDNFTSCKITNSTCEIKVQLAKSTCVIPDICDQLYQIFSSDIFCLNPYFLLVIHQSQDFLVRK